MQSHHAHLDMNVHQGAVSKVSSKTMLKSLATAALQHVPGANKIIEEHFNVLEKVDQHKLVPSKAKNQSFHLGW